MSFYITKFEKTVEECRGPRMKDASRTSQEAATACWALTCASFMPFSTSPT